MERRFVHAEGLHFLQQRRLFFSWDILHSGQPREDKRVGKVEKMFELIEFRIAEMGKRRISETAHQKVHLARAAVPSAESNAAAADLTVHLRRAISHGNPFAAGFPQRAVYAGFPRRAVYIDGEAPTVTRPQPGSHRRSPKRDGSVAFVEHRVHQRDHGIR
jgi:hypothetical protein